MTAGHVSNPSGPGPGTHSSASARRIIAVAAASVLLFGAARGVAAGEEGVLGEIEAELRRTVVAGWQERDAAKVLGIYSADAQVVGFIIGFGTPAKVREFIERDFSLHREVRAGLADLSLLSFEDGVATVRFKVPLQLITNSGENSVVRNDTVYMRLRREPDGWRAFLQGYRPDFGHTELIHGGGKDTPKHPPLAPAPPAPATQIEL